MADGLAVAASIIAVIQIADRVISLSHKFVGKVRGADREIFQMINTISALKGILELLRSFVQDDNKSRLRLLCSLCNSHGPLEICQNTLAGIESKLPTPKKDHTGVFKAVTWPWKWEKIGPDLEVIEKQKTLMILAMQGDLTQTVQRIEDTHHAEKRLKILEWISDANFSTTRHEAISTERVENSGTWFLQSEPFQNWLNNIGPNMLCYKGVRITF